MMKEKPILFNGAMVRAILEGQKTMTRRVVKCIHDIERIATPDEWNAGKAHPNMRDFEEWGPRDGYFLFCSTRETIFAMPCPYQVGQSLWVRETWSHALDFGKCTDNYFYKATYVNGGPFDDVEKWRPSIHMPRVASRINLEVTNIKVERLQDISDEDCQKEGLKLLQGGIKSEFAVIWDSTTKTHPWSSNPWVWCISFKRV
jgi:hypothetical protein